jgi:hypothetical protein
MLGTVQKRSRKTWFTVTIVQSGPNLEKSAKNESTLLRPTIPIGFQKMYFFEKDCQIVSTTDAFNENFNFMST